MARPGDVTSDYKMARAYHWFSQADLDRFPLLPHIHAYGTYALHHFGNASAASNVTVAHG